MLSIGDSKDIFLIAVQMTGNLEIESPRRLAGPDYFLLADNPSRVSSCHLPYNAFEGPVPRPPKEPKALGNIQGNDAIG